MFEIKLRGKIHVVRFRHAETFVHIAAADKPIMRMSTICEIHREGKYSLYGQAVVRPGDSFVKSLGREIALSKAVSGMARSSRKKFWKAYWKAVEPIPDTTRQLVVALNKVRGDGQKTVSD